MVALLDREVPASVSESRVSVSGVGLRVLEEPDRLAGLVEAQAAAQRGAQA